MKLTINLIIWQTEFDNDEKLVEIYENILITIKA